MTSMMLLRDGSTVSYMFCKNTMQSIAQLLKENPAAIITLAMKCAMLTPTISGTSNYSEMTSRETTSSPKQPSLEGIETILRFDSIPAFHAEIALKKYNLMTGSGTIPKDIVKIIANCVEINNQNSIILGDPRMPIKSVSKLELKKQER